MAWKKVRFSGQDFSRTISCEKTPYTMIRGDDFYNKITPELELLGVTFHWNNKDIKIEKNSITADGKKYNYDLVIDSSFCQSSASSILWQSFAGLFIETKEPVFNSSEAILMELKKSSSEAAVSFMYVLPFTSNSALIEHTTFSSTPQNFEYHKEECLCWMKANKITEWKVVDSEHAAIPMGLRALEPLKEWPVIGTSGQAIRAATGFGFQNILSQVENLTKKIVTYDFSTDVSLITINPSPFWQRWSDKLFLYSLSKRPQIGEELLAGPLRNANDQDVIAFLSGHASLAETLRFIC